MVISLIIGNVLLIAIACSNPMYSEASLQRMLTDDMADYIEAKNVYPTRLLFSSEMKAEASEVAINRFIEVETKAENATIDMGVAEKLKVDHYYLKRLKSLSTLEKEEKRELSALDMGYMSDLAEHINIVSGEMYADEPEADGTIQAIVSEKAMVEMNLIQGEVLELYEMLDENGNPLRIRIVGVFENAKADDLYWVFTPTAYSSEVFISEEIFTERFMTYGQYNLAASWFVLLDYSDMKADQVDHYLELSAEYKAMSDKAMSNGYRESFTGVLETFKTKETKVRVTLLVLQVPVLVLLCSFIFMIAGQMLEMEQNEIAMLKSRGSARGQILLVYLIQSIMIAGVSFLMGLPLGSFLCKALGSANAFLEFVQRRSLGVSIDETVILYGLGAAVLSVGAMVLPVIKHSKVTIVDYKRKKNRKGDAAFWQRMYLDVMMLGASLYGYYSFYQQQDITLKKVLMGESIDPLLYISSSLFIIGAALVSLRVLPLITRIIYRIFRGALRPSAYASFLQIIRTGSRQRFIMVFLMLTIALGIFNAGTARTILSNAERNLRYNIGADVVLKEKWEDNSLIIFNTLHEYHVYKIFAVFKTTASVNEGFKYHRFVDAETEAEFNAFVKECKRLSFYDTGITPVYGDKMICLSTCEYTLANGRLVVAAVRIS